MMTKIDRMVEMIWEARDNGDEVALAILEDCINALFEAHYVCESTRDWLMDQFNESDDEPLFEEFHEDDVDEVLPPDEPSVEFLHTLEICGVKIENCTYLDVIRVAQDKGVCDLYAAYSDFGDVILNMYTDDFATASDFVAKNGCGAVCTATVLDGMLSFYDNIFELARVPIATGVKLGECVSTGYAEDTITAPSEFVKITVFDEIHGVTYVDKRQYPSGTTFTLYDVADENNTHFEFKWVKED